MVGLSHRFVAGGVLWWWFSTVGYLLVFTFLLLVLFEERCGKQMRGFGLSEKCELVTCCPSQEPNRINLRGVWPEGYQYLDIEKIAIKLLVHDREERPLLSWRCCYTWYKIFCCCVEIFRKYLECFVLFGFLFDKIRPNLIISHWNNERWRQPLNSNFAAGLVEILLGQDLCWEAQSLNLLLQKKYKFIKQEYMQRNIKEHIINIRNILSKF